MRVVLNADTCSFHGECVENLPEVFSWAEDDTVAFVATPATTLRERLQEVCRLCPTQSISIEDSEG